MNVLQVNSTDLDGRRFNGYDLISDLEGRGVSCQQAVLTKRSNNPAVFHLWKGHVDEGIHYALSRIENEHSMFDLLFPWLRLLTEREEFLSADVVHYHLIHNQMTSLFDLPWLFRLKPSVLTLHDPWFFTGHCVYPRSCQRWLKGCGECPTLDAIFPMTQDNTEQMWRIKRDVFAQLDVDIVVASDHMRDMVRRSPVAGHLERVHLIPFGVDPAMYLPDAARTESRRALGIPENDFVILFRSTTSPYKGLQYLIEALVSRPPARATTLLAVDQRHLLGRLSNAYNVIELGWVDDDATHARMYSAADVLAMPSTAEAFGLMALEAMAAGRPIVSFEGTSLPSVTRAPDCGIAVPMADAAALRDALDMLALHPDEASRRGQLGRRLATEVYGHERYLASIANLYRAVHERSQAHRP